MFVFSVWLGGGAFCLARVDRYGLQLSRATHESHYNPKQFYSGYKMSLYFIKILSISFGRLWVIFAQENFINPQSNR